MDGQHIPRPFSLKDAGENGFAGIAPVKSFPPNGYDLYNVADNVWNGAATGIAPITMLN